MIGQKVVGMKDFESKGGDRVFRKVAEVAGGNHVAASNYGGGKNMTVVGIGKDERGDG